MEGGREADEEAGQEGELKGILKNGVNRGRRSY
jgi:hypothetical protein